MRFSIHILLIAFCVFAYLAKNRVFASALTIGPDGINSAGLTLADGTTTLDGSGIGIGQVEPSRVAMAGVDGTNKLHSSVNPTAVFRQDGPATVADLNNATQASHAMRVAGVLISSDPTATGVAPGASLYSSTHDTNAGTLNNDDDLTMRTIQHVATQPNVRVVNHSYRKVYAAGTMPDGNDLLSAGVDWSAAKHDVLHVTSGNNMGSPAFSPKANFNGMVIGSSSRLGNTGKYRVYDGLNLNIPLTGGGRTAIDLLAPGFDVRSTIPNNMLSDPIPQSPNVLTDDGASFAAPHVSGTVALLQQYGAERIGASATDWTGVIGTIPSPRRHEVMKAVLMNSVDKIEDISGTGKFLGMDRTILDSSGDDWRDSPAFTDTFMPLDDQLGAGHLNAERALQQYLPGEQDPGTVPTIGWDFETTGGVNTETRYAINTSLQAGNFISITLAWDRIVEFDDDFGTTGVFDVGDTFETYPTGSLEEQINDLGIYLVPAGQDISSAPVGAVSDGGVEFGDGFNLEHLFFEIPTTGMYDIVVPHNNTTLSTPLPAQDYALAWWYGLAPNLVVDIPGDFDGDDDVDGDDLMDWESAYAMTNGGDADGDGDSDGSDFLVWQRNYTGSLPVSSTTQVPEPSGLWMLMLGLLFALGGEGIRRGA